MYICALVLPNDPRVLIPPQEEVIFYKHVSKNHFCPKYLKLILCLILPLSTAAINFANKFVNYALDYHVLNDEFNDY